LDSGFETDTLDFEFFAKAFAHATDHVVDKRAAEAVKGLGIGVVALAADDDLAVLDLQAGAAREFPVELALWSFDLDLLALNFDFDFGRDNDGLFTDARHKKKNVLPDEADEFAADVFAAGLGVSHDAFGRGDNGDA